MWNLVGNGGVGMWWITLMWNVPENGDAKYGGKCLRGYVLTREL